MKSSSPLKWFATREGLYYVALAVLLSLIHISEPTRPY